MGFGFNLFFVLILVPLLGILLLVSSVKSKRLPLKILGIACAVILFFAFLTGIFRRLNSNIELSKNDYYGEYVINRDCFPGNQANWQYDHFRFEITDKDSIFFYVTKKDKVLKTYRGKISSTTPYSSARLIIEMEKPTHHILLSNPTTYRSTRDFYLVFKSPKFKNVFFKKGKWAPIE
ncbi:MAG: hypothetical protein AAGI38_11320 [Bacteroidota bacterium]